MKPVISVKGLSVSYESTRVLANIFLDLTPGSIYGVIGPNGAGKSTLFKAILGIIPVNTGHIQIEGKPIDEVRKVMAYVPQKDEVDWSFPATVFDIVLMGRYPHKRFFERMNKDDRNKAEEALVKMGIEELRNRQIGALSGGQQQRVFLARALCQEARIFLLDEPFVGVDMTTEHKIIDIMKYMAAEGNTFMVVHHDLASADDYFDQIIMLNQRLIACGPTKDVFTRENISKTYAPQLKIFQQLGLLEGRR